MLKSNAKTNSDGARSLDLSNKGTLGVGRALPCSRGENQLAAAEERLRVFQLRHGDPIDRGGQRSAGGAQVFQV